MNWLKDKLFLSSPFIKIGEHLAKGGRFQIRNAPGALSVLAADYVVERSQRPVLLVADTLEDAEEFADDLTELVGEENVCLMPGRPQLSRDLTPVEQSERAEVLLKLQDGGCPVVVAPVKALLDPLPPPDSLQKNLYVVSAGETLPRDSLLEYLVKSGYKREVVVEGVGQFAVRGAVIDIYPFGAAEPARIEFFGDDVESLRAFDPSTQKSTHALSDATLLAAELPGEQTSHLIEHLPATAVILWADGRDTWNDLKRSYDERLSFAGERRIQDLASRATGEDAKEDEDEEIPELSEILGEVDDDENGDSGNGYIEIPHSPAAEARPSMRPVDPNLVRRAARSFAQIFLNTTPFDDDPFVDLEATPQERFASNLPLVADRLREYHERGVLAVILSDNRAAGERLAQVLMDRGCPAEAFCVREGGLHHGFTLPSAGIAVLVDHDIFGRMRRRRRFMKFKNVVPLHDIDALKPGDYVVHVDHGIGRYQGMTRITVGGVTREVLKIQYRDDVTLFVPLENLAQVQKYSGREGFQPPLSKIGGRDWKELKKKTKKSLLSIAEDLIKLYAERRAVRGYEYSEDTAWQREMEASFPYEDTPDQTRAAEDVKRDMERAQPMDRLICGDVGYGKTEVAMRSAFKAVTDGKQVAVLVPTTILAQQHQRTFRERFKGWPVTVEAISRFQSYKEQRMTLKKLGEGQVDVIIGTHRLLSKDVKFEDLGLLIIDEEHRFGVMQKEKIKSMRANIDVLSMSATPIPRTLHMALMGARDLSQLNTPPPNRQPIETDVVPFSEKVIKDAISYELERGGQVFFVHNRVQSIYAVKRMLERVLPGVRFAVGHGQMDEDDLAAVMVDFIEGRYDVLISTMIIESGLDLPNVNTMIVNRADQFGVAQLHQLRGRIGRSSRKAYAYLLVPPKFEMTRMARQRLAALTNFSSLGAGFQLAMRDLEIRGAGNLLGREQSGYINAVGFEMYQRLIEESVREVRAESMGNGKAEESQPELKLKLDADAFFPEAYVPEGSLRLNYYRELSKAREVPRVDELSAEVADRFGKLPDAALNLFDMVRIRILGERLGAEKISISAREAVVEFTSGLIPRERILEITASSADFPVEISASGPFRLKLPLGLVREWREKLAHALRYLNAIAESPAEVIAD